MWRRRGERVEGNEKKRLRGGGRERGRDGGERCALCHVLHML